MLAMHVQTSVYRQMHQPIALSRIDMNSDRVPSVAERTYTEPLLCASDGELSMQECATNQLSSRNGSASWPRPEAHPMTRKFDI